MEFADDAEKSFTNALTVLQVRFRWTLVKYTFSMKYSNLVFINNLIKTFLGVYQVGYVHNRVTLLLAKANAVVLN